MKQSLYKRQMCEMTVFRELERKTFFPVQVFVLIMAKNNNNSNSYFLNTIYFIQSSRMQLGTSILSEGGRKKLLCCKSHKLLCFNGFVLYLL